MTKPKCSALARKDEAVRRKMHGDAHVDRGYAEAEALMSMFHEATQKTKVRPQA